MPNRNLLRSTVAALILIQIASGVLHFGEVLERKPDFAALYGTGSLVLRGEKPPYDPSAISGVDVGLNSGSAAPQVPSSKIDTLHPPFEVLIFAPLALLPYTTAYIVWFACNLIAIWSVPLLLWSYLGRLHADFHYIVILFGSFAPLIMCLIFGQDSILLLLLLTSAYISLQGGHELRAGLFLGLGMFKFQLILPIVAFYMVVRSWRIVLGFLGGVTGLTLGAVAVMGLRSVLNYFPFVIAVSRHVSTNASDRTAMMPNIRGLVSLVAGHFASPTALSIIVVLISAIIWILAAIWTVKQMTVPLAIRFSLFVTISSLVSYHCYVYNSAVLLLPLLLTANEFNRADFDVRFKWLFGVAAIAMYVVPNLEPLQVGMPTIALASLLLGTLLFLYPRASRLRLAKAAEV